MSAATPARRLVPLLLAVLVLASGCGGTGPVSAQVLEESVVLVRDRTDYALAGITQARSKEELLERMDDASDAIDDAAADLDRIAAPAAYGRAVGILVDSLHQLAFDLRATAAQIRQPGFEELLTGTRGLSFESWDAVNRSLGELRREGIEVPPLARH